MQFRLAPLYGGSVRNCFFYAYFGKGADITDESQAKAGDLVFFTKTTADTSKYITHVELYLGDGRMIGAGDPVAVHDFHKAYYQNHFVAFGRVK